MKTLLFSLLFLPTILQAQEGWKNIGPVDREIQHMAVHGDLILCAASTVDGDRLFRSTDAGKTWSILPSGVRKMAIIPDGIPTIVGSIPPNRDFLISTDMGETWDTTGTPPPGDVLQRIYVKENVPGLLFAITSFFVAKYERLFLSTDYGRSWTYPYDFPKSTDGSWLTVGLSPTTPDIYVNADTDIGGQYFYHSPDDGVTWEYVNLGRFINQIMVDPDSSQKLYASIIGGIHKSTDGGYSWQQIFAGITILQDKENPNLLLTVGRPTGIQPGIIVSEDRGNSWKHDSTSAKLPFKQLAGSFEEITWLQYDPARRRLYIQTDKGIYMRENFLTRVWEGMGEKAFRMSAYPQPAWERLIIRTEQHALSRASISIFNSLGRHISILPVETENVVWNLLDENGNPVPNGVYIFVLSNSRRISSQRVIVLR